MFKQDHHRQTQAVDGKKGASSANAFAKARRRSDSATLFGEVRGPLNAPLKQVLAQPCGPDWALGKRKVGAPKNRENEPEKSFRINKSAQKRT